MRRPLKNPFTLLLRHATQHAKLLALLPQFLVISQAMKNLLLRLVANGAGVVEDEIRFLNRRDLPVALRQERAHDFLRVMHVHLAAESLWVEVFLGSDSHKKQV